MLEVYGRRNSSNVIPVMWTVGEIGLEHRRHDLGGSFGGLDTGDFGKLNPNRKIPVIDDGGDVLYESNTIVRYLCARYGAGGLCPAGDYERALADQWMEWFKTTVYPEYIGLFFSIVRVEPEQRDPARIERHAANLARLLGIAEQALERSDFLAGDALTMADIPLGSAAYRYFTLDVDRPDLPALGAWYERLSRRPAYRQHVMIPFGRNPAEWLEHERDTGR